MKEKYNNSKMSAEELAKTQVLNLNDVEKLANYEKSISKKPAIILGIIGIFALTIGISYPKITSYLKQDEENVISNRIDNPIESEPAPTYTNEYNLNSQLTCTKTTLADIDGTDKTLTYNFSFVNNALQNYTKLAIFNITTNSTNGQETIENLYNTYFTLSQVPITGYFLQVSKTSNGITINTNIDLTKLDIPTFPDSHRQNYLASAEFSLNTTKDAIYNYFIKNGFTCN